ncbi:MAG TPA: hypothetical protein VIG30_12550 [Ktedonobacterales bacterium]|jgi:hypothetical protein
MATFLTLTIQAQVLGQRRPAVPDWEMTLAPTADADGTLSLRQLLTLVVTHEVEAFALRREERRLARVLLPEEIARGAALGKVAMGGDGDGRDVAQSVSVEEAVATALQAFADGFYFVFLDGQQVQQLDEVVVLREGGRLRFVRLMPLAGG